MTEEEIQERNKQIALMLGAIYSSNGEAWGFGNAKNIGSKMFHGVMYKDVIQAERFEKELKFHSDWNWLMEAVTFCKSKIGTPSSVKIACLNGDINKALMTAEKEAVFIAVSDFAKLHNEKG
jgi:hypothetical protein